MLVLVLAVVFVGIRRFAFMAVERRGLIGAPNGPETPATFGAPFQELSIASGDRKLDATLVRAASDTAPALLIFHGTAGGGVVLGGHAGAPLPAWRHVDGVRLFGFRTEHRPADGSASRGRRRLRLRRVRAARRTARPTLRARILVRYGRRVRRGRPICTPPPAGVVFVASYSSARDGAVAFGLIPKWATILLPDLWNNVRDARNLRQPLLVMQSDADQLFPVSMAKAVYDAATVPKQMVVLHGYRHEDGHQRPTDDYWAPVVRFL